MTSGVGEYGTNYDGRAGVAVFGLGDNLVPDAFYRVARVDGDRQLLNWRQTNMFCTSTTGRRRL